MLQLLLLLSFVNYGLIDSSGTERIKEPLSLAYYHTYDMTLHDTARIQIYFDELTKMRSCSMSSIGYGSKGDGTCGRRMR